MAPHSTTGADRPTDRRRSDRRVEMVEALIDLIAADGIEAASVRRVARRVGVSIGAVQHHFPSKARMLLAASDELFARTARQVAEATAGRSAEDRLRATARWLVPPATDDPLARVWLSLATLSVFDDEAGEAYRHSWDRVRHGLASLMQEVRPRRSPASAEASATALLGLCDGLAVSVLAERGQVPPEHARRLVDQWVTSWLDGGVTFAEADTDTDTDAREG